MCNVSCVHVNTYKTKDVVCSYEILHAYYVSCIAEDSWKRKARDCLCMTESCKTRYQRVHACLSCTYFGCFNKGHIHEHAKAKNHLLAMDANYGHVYCFACEDYRYDADFDKISQKHLLLSVYRKDSSVNNKLESTMDDLDLLSKNQIINASNIGLRGIVNLGNTCYLSVIVQCLVHAPAFRNYLLSFKHNCEIQNTNGPSCFACEMSDIVLEFFSGKQEAFVPARLLYLLWIHNQELKGYMQQDAHHCFLALLNNLHLSCQGSSDNSLTSDHSCKCIIDSIFTGLLQYEYTCTKCKNVSIQNTSFKDISLDVELHSHPSSENCDSASTSTLHDCLRRDMKCYIPFYRCSKCLQIVDCSMQMTLKKLPHIIIFHLKQSCNPKIFIDFPEILDMSSYVLSSVIQSSQDDKSFNAVNGKPRKNKFYLFAVVEHGGTRSGGHYKCYIRRHKQSWFSCNDEEVDPITIENVLKIKAYLLFYHRLYLDYEVKNSEDESFS